MRCKAGEGGMDGHVDVGMADAIAQALEGGHTSSPKGGHTRRTMTIHPPTREDPPPEVTERGWGGMECKRRDRASNLERTRKPTKDAKRSDRSAIVLVMHP